MSQFPPKSIVPIASDHAGFELKKHLLKVFPKIQWKDLGPFSTESVDYPDYAALLTTEMKKHKNNFGILICGSGQGMAIRANRESHIRAALALTEEPARMSRLHNDANVLCLGARLTEFSLAEKIVETFLKTDFEGGRHQARVDKLNC